MRNALVEFLATELAPREGRAQSVLRIACACSITVAIAMVFRIPELTYMAYIVFLISKDESSATVTAGAGALLAATLAALLNLGLLLIDTAEPALRLPAMALATFIGMYCVRTLALGPIAYLAGFIVVLLQSVVDDIPSPEALTRLSLWLWVVVLVPIAIVVVLQLAFEPASSAAHPESPKHKEMFVPDAFTNPAHWQFALKTTLAVMVVYITYTLLNYPGLRTSIVTCFFVALGSLGETVHKLTLRVSGAIIGGLVAGICIVWVLPHMTEIGQLCALIALVAAGAGWIATSSERLAYAGMQIAFAFFLGVLQGYGPATDLSVLRDRVMGILLGNVVITLVFSMLWPESARTRLHTSLAQALDAMSDLLRTPGTAQQSRIRVTQALAQAQHYLELSGFELSLLPADADRDTSMVERVRKLAEEIEDVTAKTH